MPPRKKMSRVTMSQIFISIVLNCSSFLTLWVPGTYYIYGDIYVLLKTYKSAAATSFMLGPERSTYFRHPLLRKRSFPRSFQEREGHGLHSVRQATSLHINYTISPRCPLALLQISIILYNYPTAAFISAD